MLQRASQVVDRNISESGIEEPEQIASDVDELTHAELLCMYQDAEENIRFSKLIQWRTTGATFAIFLIFALFNLHYVKSEELTKVLAFLTYMVGGISIYMLVIFQLWQGTEREKIQIILSRLSNITQKIYNIKSKQLANLERYILLCFMCCTILTGGFMALCQLMQWFPN